MNKERCLLALASILFAIVALLVFVATRLSVNHAVAQVMMMFVGMLAIASVSAISRYVEATSPARLVRISFNETQARHALDNTIAGGPFGATKDIPDKQTPWDLTSDTLMTQDPVLALAKLRIDLEQQLRRIAYQNNVAAGARRVSISQVINALEARKVIDPSLSSALRDVLPACDLAIHGGDVTPEVAADVLNVGEDIVRILQARF